MKRLLTLFAIVVTVHFAAYSQYNTERLLDVSATALDNRDYVVVIQHCNNIISNRPYLYRAWFYRGIAKQRLGDYTGAEEDFNQAVKLNPYVHELFRERANNRIVLRSYVDAIRDYDRAIALDPDNKEYWFNRALSRYYQHEVQQTRHDLQYILKRWPALPNTYALMTETYLNANDTLQARQWAEKTVRVNPYDGNSWSILGRLYLRQSNWRKADQAFGKAIHYTPNVVNNYTYRAMCRVNLNKLRQAMEDFNKAIEMDPNSFLAHYNRGLLGLTVGDDNNAIKDFSYVLRLEPNNLQALYNRALLLDRVGDYRGAISDYSRVISKFPNFWSGLLSRAKCYRHLGLTAKAELDEFRVLKAQMNKHLGIQQRWSKEKLRSVRKMNDFDIEKYDQWIVLNDEVSTPQYSSKIRGYIQNREVSTDYMPLYFLSLQPYSNGINEYQIVNKSVDAFNLKKSALHKLYVSCRIAPAEPQQAKQFFQLIETLTSCIQASTDMKVLPDLLLQRAVAYTTTYNYEAALNDLNACIEQDSTLALAYWQRAACLLASKEHATPAKTNGLFIKKVADDLKRAIALDAGNPYLLYDLGNVYALQNDYTNAITCYESALKYNSRIAEAYYNRGIVKMALQQRSDALKDLGTAGELGLYDAYALIKRYSTKK